MYISFPCHLLIFSSGAQSVGVVERKSNRVLTTTNEEDHSQNENPIKQVTDPFGMANTIRGDPDSTGEQNSKVDPV